MCPGNRVIFTCQQSGFATTWTINLQPPLHQNVRLSPLASVGSVISFGADSGFNFEVQIESNSSGIITTELRVTAVRELNGVRVECTGGINGTFPSTIQVASVGEVN